MTVQLQMLPNLVIAERIKTIKVELANLKTERNKRINHMYFECDLSQRFLAKLFNMSQFMVHKIVNNNNNYN